jgi:hypothetical protein
MMSNFLSIRTQRALLLALLVEMLVKICFILVFRRVRKIAKSDYYRRHVRPSAWNNSAPTGRILMKLDI